MAGNDRQAPDNAIFSCGLSFCYRWIGRTFLDLRGRVWRILLMAVLEQHREDPTSVTAVRSGALIPAAQYLKERPRG